MKISLSTTSEFTTSKLARGKFSICFVFDLIPLNFDLLFCPADYPRVSLFNRTHKVYCIPPLLSTPFDCEIAKFSKYFNLENNTRTRAPWQMDEACHRVTCRQRPRGIFLILCERKENDELVSYCIENANASDRTSGVEIELT